MAEWRDGTSYAAGERGKKAQTVWTADADKHVTLHVIRGSRSYPDVWSMHCYALGIQDHALGLPLSVEPEVAQHAAKNYAASEARRIASALSKL